MITYYEMLRKMVQYAWMENWYDKLPEEITIPAKHFRLSKEEFEGLLPIIDGDDSKLLPTFLAKIETHMADLKRGMGCKAFFVRLGSRSPKDHPDFGPCYDSQGLITLFAESMRIGEDLVLCEKINYLPYLFIRPWIQIDKKHEFRCFCKDGKLVGVSQYFYQERFYYLDDEAVRKSIVSQADKMLVSLAACLDTSFVDMIFDIIYRPGEVMPLLIEINPWSSWTDPCLFDWARDTWETFDFRWFVDEKLVN